MTSSLAVHGPTPPIGLAYIGATLRDAGYRVDMIDSAGEGIDTISDMESPIGAVQRIGLPNAAVLDRIDPDTMIFGFTNMFLHEWPELRRLVEAVKATFPSATTVLGGENASAFWTQIFEQTTAVDYVVRGEGEMTMLALVERIVAGDQTSDIAGVVAHPNRVNAIASPAAVSVGSGSAAGSTITPSSTITPGQAPAPLLPKRLRRVDDLALPAWDLLPMQNYFDNPFFGVNRGRSMQVLATRGCPYKCSFCSSPQMWTTRYVVRDPERLVDEIAHCVKEYGAQNIDFCDLTAITKRRWTLDFCDALDARKLNITWQIPVGTRAEALDAEVLQRLYDTGCRNIVYAPESGSQRMLDIYDKRVNLQHILRSIRQARRIGLRTHVNVILGHPQERPADVLKSAQFLVKAAMAGCDTGAVILFCPYPGSRDYAALVESGQLVPDEASNYVALSRSSAHATAFNPYFSARRLRITQLLMLMMYYGLTFVRRPSRLIDTIRAARTGNEVTYLDQMIRTQRRARKR